MNKTKNGMIGVVFFIAVFYLGTICADYIGNVVYALNLSRVKEWSAEVLTHTDLNAEFDNILDHAIANADISASAAIVASKIDFTTASAIGSTTPSTGAFTTLSSTGATTIGNAVTDTLQINSNLIYLEGHALDAHEVTVSTGTLTADTTLTIPNITGTVVTSAGSGGNIDIGAYSLTAQQLVVDIADGTTPMTVTSTTKVSNLNADLLDGYNSSTTSAATTVPITDASGDLLYTMMPSGVPKMKTGEYTGDGNATQAITGVGFQPKFLRAYRQVTGNTTAMKTDQDGTYALKDRSGGTGAEYIEDYIISLDADGFTVGDTGGGEEMNASAVVYTYVAFTY